MKKVTSVAGLTSAQALYVVQKLLETRRISERDVRGCLTNLSDEIASLESRLSALRASRIVSAKGAAAPAPGKRQRRRKPVSAERLATMRRQGQYLGMLRQLPATKRARYSALAKKEGVAAAIAAMRKA